MNRYDGIMERIIQWGNSTDQLYAAFIIGSQARTDHPADDFSDLDMILVVDDPDDFLQSSEWLEQIGHYHVSFIENTVNGGKERRILFDNALDVDFLLFSRNGLESRTHKNGWEILKRGYRVLIDKMEIARSMPQNSHEKPAYALLTEFEFSNTVNNFWYHSVWAAKKLIRRETWTAKVCVDDYMKQLLRTLIECYAHAQNGMDYDTWHGGRFLDEWAEDWVVQKLPGCFAHYESGDIKDALISTMDLFREVAEKTAELLGYPYPVDADRYSTGWVLENLSALEEMAAVEFLPTGRG